MVIALRVPAFAVVLLLIVIFFFLGGLLPLFEALSFLAVTLPLGSALLANLALVFAFVMFALFLLGIRFVLLVLV